MVKDLQTALSESRLEAYRQPGGSDLDMVVNYLWNIDLAEAILPSLHAFEITLRNAIHNALTASEGTDLWFFKPGLLKPDQLEDFVEAYQRVYKKPEPISGRIVASLMFGFWAALLNNPYEERIWKPNGFAALYQVFPHSFKSKGTHFSRREIHDRVARINTFRNRVFHYEKIYEWWDTRQNPAVIRHAIQDHHDIHEALRWLNPTMHEAIHAVDDFPRAWSSRSRVEDELKRRLGRSSNSLPLDEDLHQMVLC
jgi:hypothetical protein